jgi:hypothetical protein
VSGVPDPICTVSAGLYSDAVSQDESEEEQDCITAFDSIMDKKLLLLTPAGSAIFKNQTVMPVLYESSKLGPWSALVVKSDKTLEGSALTRRVHAMRIICKMLALCQSIVRLKNQAVADTE